MVSLERKKQEAIDKLEEEFYKVKGELRLGYYSNIKTKALAGRKHELL